MNKKLSILLVLVIFSLFIFAASCVQAPEQNQGGAISQNKSGKIRIGLSMDTLKEERWQKDRDIFVKRAEELGAEVLV